MTQKNQKNHLKKSFNKKHLKKMKIIFKIFTKIYKLLCSAGIPPSTSPTSPE